MLSSFLFFMGLTLSSVTVAYAPNSPVDTVGNDALGKVVDTKDIDNTEDPDILLDVDTTLENLGDPRNNLTPLEDLDPSQLSQGAASIVRGRLTCADVLSGAVNMPPDSDVNLICQNCYNFCMMELVIVEYLEYIKKQGKLSEEKIRKSGANLQVIRSLIPGFLDSCAAAFWAFKTGGLRDMLMEMQVKVQQEATQVAPYE